MDFLWTVAEYSDTLRKKAERVVLREIEIAERYKSRVNHFDSEESAIAFMIGRANTKIAIAEGELKSAQDRLKKLQKKYPGQL